MPDEIVSRLPSSYLFIHRVPARLSNGIVSHGENYRWLPGMLYITEIVMRLCQSKRIKALYPDDAERLNHIFARQIYGCAPTEIIYRICLRYILGFGDRIHIEKNNIRLCDTLEYAKNGTMESAMKELFNL